MSLCLGSRWITIEIMRSNGLIVAPDIITNGTFSFSNILLTTLLHLLGFKTSKEALSGRVVPTVAFSAHTLNHAITVSD